MDRIYAPWRSRYFTMEKEDECLFCSVQQEGDDASVGILYRGDHWYVIMNMFPYTSGHVMIVAKRHIGKLAGIRPEEGEELIRLLARCEKALEQEYGPDAINAGVNRGQAAGAGIVGHLHFHLVPRWCGDTNFMTALAETRVVSEEIGEGFTRLEPYFRDPE